MRLCLTALAVSSLVVGCSRQQEPEGGEFCTLIGCRSQVTFQVPADLVAGVRYLVDACVDDVCRSEELVVPATGGPEDDASAGSLWLDPQDDSITLHLGDGEYSGVHQVSLTVVIADREEIARSRESVEFERSQPNGPGCEPVCWFANVRL